MGWVKRADEEEEKKEEKAPVIEIKPEMIRDAIKEDMDSLKTSSKAMIDFINEQKEEKQRAAEAEANRVRKEADKTEEIDFLTDPEGAMNKKLRPIAESNAVMAAMFMRREILEKEQYYDDPEFKKYVDTMLDSQPLQARMDASVIRNAYKVAVFDKKKEIEDGKIKSSLSVGGGSRGTRPDEKTSDEEPTMGAEEKEYARKMGISEKDWITQKKEMVYI